MKGFGFLPVILFWPLFLYINNILNQVLQIAANAVYILPIVTGVYPFLMSFFELILIR